MNLARAVHLDDGDRGVFPSAARTGEWCISGGFAFSNRSEADLAGRAQRAFAAGWLGVETFGRASLVAVARIEPAEFDALARGLARHFVAAWGAPSEAEALGVARAELDAMAALCAEPQPNALLTVARTFEASGIRERYRTLAPRPATLEQFAAHPR